MLYTVVSGTRIHVYGLGWEKVIEVTCASSCTDQGCEKMQPQAVKSLIPGIEIWQASRRNAVSLVTDHVLVQLFGACEP